MKKQTAPDGYLLYKDVEITDANGGISTTRLFTSTVALPDTAPEWETCTTAEAAAYEAEHAVNDTTDTTANEE